MGKRKLKVLYISNTLLNLLPLKNYLYENSTNTNLFDVLGQMCKYDCNNYVESSSVDMIKGILNNKSSYDSKLMRILERQIEKSLVS